MRAGSSLKVELLAHSGGETVAALAAKLCYSNANIGDLLKKVTSSEQESFLEKIASMGHHSVLEHLSLTFGIEGVSRTLTHQLVRHRIASYSQKSQRYVAHKNGFEYVTPPEIAVKPECIAEYDKLMDEISAVYDRLINAGVPAEDARYVLPNACETKIIVTMNARELLHFFKLRCCQRAQWEIRDMAVEMLKKAYTVAPSVFAFAGPACVGGACSEGKMTCGRPKEIRQEFKDLFISIKKEIR